jgi:hypothetical protein
MKSDGGSSADETPRWVLIMNLNFLSGLKALPIFYRSCGTVQIVP